jgi:hypothetical protein
MSLIGAANTASPCIEFHTSDALPGCPAFSSVFGHLARRGFSAGLSEVTVRRLRECLNLVKDSARAVRIFSRVTGGEKFWLDSESFMAPLSNGTDRVTAIMWVFVSWQADDRC